MSDPFLAEIRIFANNFAPVGWAVCTGQLIAISQNTSLFSLLGTFYGGDGKSTFALPDLQGRMPMHMGQGPGLSPHSLGETGGSETVTLLSSEMPIHSHSLMVAENSGAPMSSAGPSVALGSAPTRSYAPGPAASLIPMNPRELAPTGGGQPHNNMPPFLALNFCIALQGVFPPRG